MNSPYELISEDEKLTLQRLGLKPYQGRRIWDFCNPDKKIYWATNTAILFGALVGRTHLLRINGPHGLMSLPILLVPLSAFFDRMKIDSVIGHNYNSKDFDKRIDFSPLTRAAWYDALSENEKFQSQLRLKIAELEGSSEEQEE